MNEYFSSIMSTINSAIEQLDEKSFEKLVNDVVITITHGRKVILTGLGKNAPICEKCVGTMLSLGLNAVFMHTNTAIHGDMGAIHDGDMVIMLSKSGETAESVYLLNLLKQRNICLWTITFNKNSTLSRNEKTLIINMVNEGDQWDVVPNNSTTLYLIVLQAMIILSSKQLGITLDDFKKNHPGGHIGALLNEKH